MIEKVLAGLGAGILVAVLPACGMVDPETLRPGITTGHEVRERMGAPAMEWQEADGARTWEYPRTPEGIENYMIVIGPDNVLREVRQVLTEENFARVTPGMRRDEVRRLLGKPAHEFYFPLKKEHVWDWKTPGEPGMDRFFNVHFDEAGNVVRTSSNIVQRG